MNLGIGLVSVLDCCCRACLSCHASRSERLDSGTLYLLPTAGVLPPRLRRRKLSLAAKENESSEDAYERRLKESQKVEERVEVIFTEEEFRKALDEVSAPMRAWSLAAMHHSSDSPSKNLQHPSSSKQGCPSLKLLLWLHLLCSASMPLLQYGIRILILCRQSRSWSCWKLSHPTPATLEWQKRQRCTGKRTSRQSLLAAAT